MRFEQVSFRMWFRVLGFRVQGLGLGLCCLNTRVSIAGKTCCTVVHTVWGPATLSPLVAM